MTVRNLIAGDAVLGNQGYALLRHLTTRFQGRMAGTPGNAEAMDCQEERLRQLGVQTRRESFPVPGWRRGTDRVTAVAPLQRPLRAAALGYVDAHPPLRAGLAWVGNTDFDGMDPRALRGRLGLAAPHLRFSHSEYRRLADEFGLVGVLLVNRVDGGQLLARTANLEGLPAPLPVYSVSAEDGCWLQALHSDGAEVAVEIETTSACVDITTENLIAAFPGKSGQKIVLGAHFDSWDLGQGALDNGLGVAQLFDVARLLQIHSPVNEHAVEIVFFNAEEWGLWGSRDYVRRHDMDGVRAMLNLDMVGCPAALNAMGFDELVPLLKNFSIGLGSWALKPEIANKTWLGSDHHPFILEGVPSITFNAPINPERVRYYHDFADSFDKVDAEALGRATAIAALLVYELANDARSGLRRYRADEVASLFRAAGLEKQMRKTGQWPWGEEP